LVINPEWTGLYSSVARSKMKYVLKNVQHIHGNQYPNLPSGSVVAICLVKNGEYYIQAFIDHYLKIGVKHIVFMDNGSSDRTLDITAKYDRVTVVKCCLPFHEP